MSYDEKFLKLGWSDKFVPDEAAMLLHCCTERNDLLGDGISAEVGIHDKHRHALLLSGINEGKHRS